jgi:hypothetical protein
MPCFSGALGPLVLTVAGEQLFPVLRNGFDSFANAIASLSRCDEQQQLRGYPAASGRQTLLGSGGLWRD